MVCICIGSMRAHALPAGKCGEDRSAIYRAIREAARRGTAGSAGWMTGDRYWLMTGRRSRSSRIAWRCVAAGCASDEAGRVCRRERQPGSLATLWSGLMHCSINLSDTNANSPVRVARICAGHMRRKADVRLAAVAAQSCRAAANGQAAGERVRAPNEGGKGA